MSQVIAMAKRLQEAEETVLELKKALDSRSVTRQNQLPPRQGGVDPVHPSIGAFEPVHKETSKESTSEELLSDLSLDEHGKVSSSSWELEASFAECMSRFLTTDQHRQYMNPLHWMLHRLKPNHTLSRPPSSISAPF
jgi:hypothetical protein